MVPLLALAACQFDTSGGSGDGLGVIDAAPDAAPDPIDAGTNAPAHVLLTEVKTSPDTLEFIEVFNPRCEEVDLSTYYLSDDPGYPLLPSWEGPPDLGDFDAVIRFPAGATLAGGAVAVVARNGLTFTAEYGFVPDYAILNPGTADAMVFVASGSQNNMAIAPDGEPIALFEWDGMRDVVSDIDVVIAGEAPAIGRQLVPKQVLAPAGVDGPDEDTVATLYRDDAGLMQPMLVRDAPTGSYERIAFEGFREIGEGGNGIEGDDETSEDIRATWEQEVDTTPSPRELPESLMVDCDGP
jgi:hypothetical protein